jgi:hypothetical protein
MATKTNETTGQWFEGTAPPTKMEQAVAKLLEEQDRVIAELKQELAVSVSRHDRAIKDLRQTVRNKDMQIGDLQRRVKAFQQLYQKREAEIVKLKRIEPERAMSRGR